MISSAQQVLPPFPDIDAFRKSVDEVASPDCLIQPIHSNHVTAIQSHYDDFMLSACGTALQSCTALTLFTTHALSDQVALRRNEDHCIRDFVPTQTLHEMNSELSGSFTPSIAWEPKGLTIGPAAVGRHPDHIATSGFAEEQGSSAFWEDVAFWGIYGMSTDDRLYFSMRRQEWLKDKLLLTVPIDNVLRTKVWLLRNYTSQSNEVWRPIRYAWTAARETSSRAQFVERFFVRHDQRQTVTGALGIDACRAGKFNYGNCSVEVFSGQWT